jgi:H/ACA ribonucleoprotein complex subunit 2
MMEGAKESKKKRKKSSSRTDNDRDADENQNSSNKNDDNNPDNDNKKEEEVEDDKKSNKKIKSSSDTNTKTKTTTTTNKIVPSYEDRCLAVNSISYPLANKKSTKKCHKLVRKAATMKQLRRGVKEVIKGIRKGETGFVIMAGDIYPIDVISHIPLLLEEKNIPYLFVPSKFDLGAAACTKRPTSCVLIKPTTTKSSSNKKTTKKNKKDDENEDDDKNDDFQELYDTLYKEAMSFDPSTILLRS